MDMVHGNYNRLMEAFARADYRGVTIRDAITGTTHPRLLILRHDVEWNPKRALALAAIEKVHGFRSSLYFRADTKAYDLSAMRNLQDEGFEIGYHFNTLDRCGGDFDRAIALFEADVRAMREAGLRIDTVIQHGDPRVKKRGYKANGDIVERDPQLLDRNGLLAIKDHLESHFPGYFYLADIGIRWNPPATLDELIGQIHERAWPVIYILTHPDYWSRSLIRATALQVAARGLRRLRINAAIAAARKAAGAWRSSSKRDGESAGVHRG